MVCPHNEHDVIQRRVISNFDACFTFNETQGVDEIHWYTCISVSYTHLTLPTKA